MSVLYSRDKPLSPEKQEAKCRFNSYWKEIHSFARDAGSLQKREAFETWIESLAERFFCDECRAHFIDYVTDNPPGLSPDPVEWAWRFHNAVNSRLKKREFTLLDLAKQKDEFCEQCK